MKTVLVTGGVGPLGIPVSSHLRSLGYHVVCASRRVPHDATSIQMDVTDPAHVSMAIRSVKPAVIIHLAATFGSEFDAAFATNVQGARNLLAAVQESGDAARVVLAGSAAEYGLVSPDENPIREDRLLRPVSIYGLTKSWQTSWGLMCAHQGQDVVIARIFNLDGPGLSSRLFVGRIDQQIQEICSGQRQRIEVGSLSAVRDYISVEDAARQLAAIIEHGQSGQVYHVASGQPVKMRDLLARRLAMNGLDFGIVDEHASLSTRTGYDVPVVYADITRTTALLTEIKNDRN